MGSFTKWLGAGLGFTLGGPIGAIVGYAIGSFVNGLTLEDFEKEKEEYRSNSRGRQVVDTESGDFEISLLVLASVVIKADDKIDKTELDYVRLYFVKIYGKERANKAFRLFNGIIKKQVSTRQVCLQIRQHMPHSSRLQLIHFLFGIAKSDGMVSESEVEEIRKISNYLYVNKYDFESIKAMFYDASGNAYKILEITKAATNDEVKRAYRKMAKKYHPDKVQSLGKEHLEGAKEKFQKIQSAYDAIKKERGIF
ncbi:TerB family tellurite resistance protein [Tenacibaculum maritimum]|uniref:TerB family tellurite resistance protein n=1 Tax=Tenacibaculum maritimum TaxID=107401 RepID=UPI002306F00E|nr:TerB family tellurite resistance protein [Tenacibaculum maritimum]MDB0612203.1 TerB family tellurite resistance protein [Tenacibaculum maritimum]